MYGINSDDCMVKLEVREYREYYQRLKASDEAAVRFMRAARALPAGSALTLIGGAFKEAPREMLAAADRASGIKEDDFRWDIRILRERERLRAGRGWRKRGAALRLRGLP